MKKEDAILILSELMCEFASRLVYGPEFEEYRESMKEKVEALKMAMSAIARVNE